MSLRDRLADLHPLQTATLTVLGIFVAMGSFAMGQVLIPTGTGGIVTWAVLNVWATLPIVHLLVSGWPASVADLVGRQGTASNEETGGTEA